ncbi:MAG: hypothetical protein CMD22_03955 [Flavobacteriales bacterium]|nr:hypothetical protein [Flavobacteriales bacterium]|tara:strand:- start:243 stop:1979 length:1737 start_codon:yes stop_codon:yes gene_type:complete
MKQIQLFTVLLLSIFISVHSYSQGCYYGASATYTTNGGTVAFVNTSQMFSSSSWDFGDGNSSNQHDPVHTYSAIGNYTVTLNITYHWNLGVYGSFSCNQSVSGIVTISTLSAPPNILGCTDPSMFNYNPQANLDDGSCVPFQYGCTDPTASNYSSWANTDDGSCIYCPTYAISVITPGCPNNNNGILEVIATLGSIPHNTLYNWTEQVYLPPYGSQTNTLSFTGPIASGLGNNFYSVDIIHNNGCPNEYLSYQFNSTWGCTDTLASNYDATANCDDGSCSYPVTCGSVTGINITDVIHDRAWFNWDDMNSSTCDVDQIRFRYREVGSSSWLTKTMGAPLGNSTPCLNTTKRVINLTPSTQYEYDFKIWYQDGTINDWHSGGTFTTLQVCDNVTNVIATPKSSISTEFCWEEITPYSFVRLKYRVDSGGSWGNIGGMGVMSPLLCKTKNGLTPGQTYRAIWRTFCNPNGGPYRSPVWDGPITWIQPTSIRVEGGTAINHLDVYPNPSRDIFNVSFTSEDVQDLEVRVINVIGEVVYTENLNKFIGQYTKQVDLSTYTKGVYFLEITTNNGVINKKIILN